MFYVYISGTWKVKSQKLQRKCQTLLLENDKFSWNTFLSNKQTFNSSQFHKQYNNVTVTPSILVMIVDNEYKIVKGFCASVKITFAFGENSRALWKRTRKEIRSLCRQIHKDVSRSKEKSGWAIEHTYRAKKEELGALIVGLNLTLSATRCQVIALCHLPPLYLCLVKVLTFGIWGITWVFTSFWWSGCLFFRFVSHGWKVKIKGKYSPQFLWSNRHP